MHELESEARCTANYSCRHCEGHTHVRVLSCTALYSPTAQACKSGRRLCGLRMALTRSRLHKVRENAFNSSLSPRAH
eukprot:scaffold12300_cov132-Isochrysis_galbana.AAC.2